MSALVALPLPAGLRGDGVGGSWLARGRVEPQNPPASRTPSIHSIIKRKTLSWRHTPFQPPDGFSSQGTFLKELSVQPCLRPLSVSLFRQLRSGLFPQLSPAVQCPHLATRSGNFSPCPFLPRGTLLLPPYPAHPPPHFLSTVCPAHLHLCQPLFPKQPREAGGPHTCLEPSSLPCSPRATFSEGCYRGPWLGTPPSC